LRGHVPAAAHVAPIGRLPSNLRLDLTLGLPLRNRGALTNLIQQLSDPDSTNYHHYLTPAQFTEMFGPTEADYQTVNAFAQAQGLTIRKTHPNRTLLNVSGTVADIERALQVTLRLYPHPAEARTFYAPDAEPSLALAVPIIRIDGLDNAVTPRPCLKVAALNPAASPQPLAGSIYGLYLGNDFRAAYVPGVALNGAGQAVALFELDGYYPADITAYETAAHLPNVALTNVLVDGASGSAGTANGEVALDIDMAVSMAPGLSRVIIYEGPSGGATTGNINDVLNLMATDNLAKQISSSWSWNSGTNATTDQIFLQYAAQGQSFFSASGDSGAYTGSIWQPLDDPNITIVGGTALSTTGGGGTWVSETVWTGSGGGISPNYAIPSWQQGINMTTNQGSTTHRNIPDVAMCATNIYLIADNGITYQSWGTSAAAPLWAGFTALVNQQAAANGLAPVGFLNPALYNLAQSANYASCFHDIATGSNVVSGSGGKFLAVPGLDLCTGWGTPAGSGLINALAGSPAPILVSNSLALLVETCSNGLVDPGETVTMTFGLKNVGGADTTNLVATLQAGSGVTSPSAPQTYGALLAGGGAVSQPFTFTASGACGGTVTATLQLQDGAAALNNVSFTIPLGAVVPTTPLSENFDAVTAPSLPSGWTTAASGAQTVWTTTTAANDTGPNAAFSSGAASAGVNELVTPAIPITSASTSLTFHHNYNLQASTHSTTTADDGGVLEIAIGSGQFADILAAGGSFASGGYTRTISSSRGSPLAGRQAWSGNSGGFITTIVNLPAAAAGQTIRIKWRCATDNNTASSGWYVDTVSVTDNNYVCCTLSPGVPPAITNQPSSQVAAAGGMAIFNVTAAGTAPLAYQWTFAGTNLSNALAATLLLTNVQLAQAGNYAVVVTNMAGAITSAVASLRVLVSPAITGIALAGGGTSVSLSSVAGLSYTLEYKNSLTDPAWTSLPPTLPGAGPTLILQDTNANPGSRFYRVRCE
jgi:hypothetical protein